MVANIHGHAQPGSFGCIRPRGAHVCTLWTCGGDGGTRPPQSKNQRGTSPRNDDVLAFFLSDENFVFSTIFKIKWPKSEEKPNFRGRWVWVPINPYPRTKLCGDAPGCGCHANCHIGSACYPQGISGMYVCMYVCMYLCIYIPLSHPHTAWRLPTAREMQDILRPV